MNKKIVAMVLAFLAFSVIGYWAATGAHIYTQTKVSHEVKDELFGTTTTEWREEFRLGLLPTPSLSTPVEMVSAAPIAGILLAAAGLLFWLSTRNRRAAVPQQARTS